MKNCTFQKNKICKRFPRIMGTFSRPCRSILPFYAHPLAFSQQICGQQNLMKMINSSSDLVSRKTLDLRFQIQILILINTSQPKPPSLRIHFSIWKNYSKKLTLPPHFFQVFEGILPKKGTATEDSGLVFWLPWQPSDSPDPDTKKPCSPLTPRWFRGVSWGRLPRKKR